jgi:hypothetical protein
MIMNNVQPKNKKLNQKSKSHNEISNSSKKLLLVPLLVILGIIPLIIRYYEYPSGLHNFRGFQLVTLIWISSYIIRNSFS